MPEISEELDSFARMAAHDPRAPLRRQLAQWIEEDLASQGMHDETREMLQLMRVRMHRMESLIERLLDIHAPDARVSGRRWSTRRDWSWRSSIFLAAGRRRHLGCARPAGVPDGEAVPAGAAEPDLQRHQARPSR